MFFFCLVFFQQIVVLIDDLKIFDLISATTGADQVWYAKQHQTELKKNPKDTSVISASYKERNSNRDQFIKSLASNISLPLKDNLQGSK